MGFVEDCIEMQQGVHEDFMTSNEGPIETLEGLHADSTTFRKDFIIIL